MADSTIPVAGTGKALRTFDTGAGHDEYVRPVPLDAVVSSQNSTTANLGAGGVFTGEFQDLLNIPMVVFSVKSDVGSATNGVVLQWSRDGITADISLAATYVAPNMGTFFAPKRLRYFRVLYTNGATPQSSFFLESTLLPFTAGAPLIPIAAALDDGFVAAVSRSVIAGKISSGPNAGKYTNVTVNPQGRIDAQVAGDTVGAAVPATVFLVGGEDESGNAEFLQLRSGALSVVDSKQSGTWGYKAGTSGTPTIPGGAKILAISACAPSGSDGSFTVNGGDTITVPAGQNFTLEPRGNLVGPAVVFTGTASFVVEYTT